MNHLGIAKKPARVDDYPPVRTLLKDGWTFGEKPTEEEARALWDMRRSLNDGSLGWGKGFDFDYNLRDTLQDYHTGTYSFCPDGPDLLQAAKSSSKMRVLRWFAGAVLLSLLLYLLNRWLRIV